MAALCWAVASLISADVTRTIGGLAFNRLRLFFVSIMLVSYTFYLGTWDTINQDFLVTILLSGIIGIFLGDTLLFVALQKIGPRRNNILFSLAAPFTVILNNSNSAVDVKITWILELLLIRITVFLLF